MARDIVLGVALPAMLAFLLAWAAGRLWRVGSKRLYLPANVAFAGAFLAGFGALALSPWWPRERDYEWLPHLSILAGVAAVAARLTNVPYLRWSPIVLVPLVAAWLLVPDWPKLQSLAWYWRAGIGIAMIGTWLSLQLPAEQIGGPQFTLWLALIHVAAASLLFLTGSAKFAQLSMLSAAAFAGIFAAELADRGAAFLPGVIPAFAVLHAGWLGTAMLRVDAEACKLPFVLMWLAPSCLGLMWLPWFRRTRWIGAVFSMGGAAVLAAIAIALAWFAQPSETW